MPFFLPAVVTQENALQIQGEGLLNTAALKLVNCSALKEFDSSILAVLLGWHKKLKLNGESLVVEQAPEKLRVLANVYGISALLSL
jgi:phospholipid transport system transporter-binding protein